MRWPLAVDPALEPALDCLMTLGESWAGSRGWTWGAVLNGGSGDAVQRFRWEVVAAATAFAAGRAPEAPADCGALPVGLQRFLRWGIPAALVAATRAPQGPDTGRSRAALAAAEALAADIDAALGGPPRKSEPTASPPTAPAERDTGKAVPLTAPRPAVEDLLAGALAAAAAPAPLTVAAEELLARLRRSPVRVAEVRDLAARHGRLPGTVLEALDVAAARRTGGPATVRDGETLTLSAAYRAALEEDEALA